MSNFHRLTPAAATWETTRDVLQKKENKNTAGTTNLATFDYGLNALAQRETVSATGTAFATAANWNGCAVQWM